MKKITLLLLLLTAYVGNAQLASGSTAPDFTATDINGNVHHLTDYLSAGKTVIIDISATWCAPCWNYHKGRALDDIYSAFGPEGSNEVVVLFVEGDNATTLADLNGTGNNTQGDWVADSDYPIIDSGALASLYQITYFPTIYRICPNQILTELSQPSAASIKSGINSNCGALVGTQNNILAMDTETGLCTTTGSPTAKVKNYGINTVTSAVVNLLENGNVVATKASTGSFAQFSTKAISFDPLVINPSSTYTVQVATVNGAANYNPNNSTANSSIYVATPTTQDIEVRVYTDNYPTEMAWRIKNSASAIVASGGPYVGNANGGGADANTTKIHNVTLPAANECYRIELVDSYGDGWSGGNTPHGIEIFSNGVSVYNLPVENFGALLTKMNALKTEQLGVDNFSKNNVSVYPNPTNGIVHFSTESAVNVEVVDVMGKVVFYAKNVTTETNVDLSALQKGIYLAKVTGENINFTEKIILN